MLASNRRVHVHGNTLYFRVYPSKGLVAQTVGYSTQGKSRSGLEESMNDYLIGANSNLNTVLSTTFDKLKGTTVKGNDLVLTLTLYASYVAWIALVIAALLRRRDGATDDLGVAPVVEPASAPGLAAA